jgi:hypothetical protein
MKFWWLGLLSAGPMVVCAQTMEGELRVTVRDPLGKPVAARVAVDCRSPQFATAAVADTNGEARLERLPLGVYRMVISHAGFATHEESMAIRSPVPQVRTVTLALGTVSSTVTVRAEAELLDQGQPAQIAQRGPQQLEETLGTTLGRSMIDVITTLPGWLVEANAVLHPRGSEYDTQYVIDGMPLYDNRSLAFAPAFENHEFAGVNVFTAGIPAEYGRRLGGVIALDTRRRETPGYSSDLQFQSGSYGTNAGAVGQHYRNTQTALSLGLHAGQTNRYLDPPSLENYTNKGSASGMNARLDRNLGGADRISVYVRSNRTGFLVPNTGEQEEQGQRQDRRNSETAGQAHYQHVLSSRALLSVRGMVRDLSARLWSNPLSTPVYVDQNRGFREGAAVGAVTLEGEHHTVKLGGDVRVSQVRERFLLAEPDELPDYDIDFGARRRATETSVYMQDHWRWGGLAVNAGLRVDHYRFLIRDTALSPRVALSYYVPGADVQLRASYDRVFQPPPIENLLLSSSGGGLSAARIRDNVPVPASRAHFFEVGVRKPVGGVLRLDVSHYRRRFRNYVDDDVFLNTGVSFPITFAAARIAGTEVRLEMPRYRRFSSYVSYSNMLGTATSPVTGGLFIRGGEADELREVTRRFPITQDQRNTVAGQVRYEPWRRVWLAAETRYGSGLPVELDDEDEDEDDGDDDGGQTEPIPRAIVEKIDFARSRVRPNFSLNLSGGWRLWEADHRAASLQVDLRNVTNRLNVINFSGLFSGTALAPGRQATLQLRFRF